MSVKQFPSQALVELLFESETVLSDGTTLERIETELIESSRWETYYWLVFRQVETGKYYRASYSEGNTEMQDSMLFGPDELIDCVEVAPKEVTIIQYEVVA